MSVQSGLATTPHLPTVCCYRSTPMVFLQVRVCVYVCMYVWTHLHIYIYGLVMPLNTHGIPAGTCVCTCVCILVHMYVCIYLYSLLMSLNTLGLPAGMYVCMYISMQTFRCIYTSRVFHVFTRDPERHGRMCVHMCTCVCMYTYTYTYTYTCTYTCTCTCTYTRTTLKGVIKVEFDGTTVVVRCSCWVWLCSACGVVCIVMRDTLW